MGVAAMASDEQIWNIQFVQEIEKYPCIYSYTSNEYSNKDVREKAWKQVANEIEDTVNNCKEKWRNLRTVFVRKLKLQPSGSGRASTKPYYLNEAMQFFLPYVTVHQPTGTPGNLPSLKETQEDIQGTKEEDCDGNLAE
ncbi:uncharacterized protein [Macrobrachium rosenbergii]|uniref:uncharacterized protein n=1 Tax=Macrobrachium rosenbergii TaxID=79674 RepID=UPI0034D5D868